jgi:polyisoprenoid-binding protein YceI
MLHKILTLSMTQATAAALALTLSVAAQADWTVDNNDSRLSYVTIKANTIAEVNYFGEVDGLLEADGHFELNIMLASVETGIPIRNERMRQLFFDTEVFPTATLSANLDMEPLMSLATGEQMVLATGAQLTLLGNQADLTVDAVVARLDAHTLLVSSLQPLVINAEALGLGAGVEQLREIAGLPSISPAVPVSFRLTLRESTTPES